MLHEHTLFQIKYQKKRGLLIPNYKILQFDNLENANDHKLNYLYIFTNNFINYLHIYRFKLY